MAGAGKSTLLSAARLGWEQQGYRVIGAALSGKAADGLDNASGIACRTLASLEYCWKNGYHKLQAGDILVIDEAGMVGTRQLARLIDHVKQAGAKLVLVVDPEQLQPIQPGTPFKNITEQISTARLTEIRRQTIDWQRKAPTLLAIRKTKEALQIYQDKGCVKTTNDRSDAIAAGDRIVLTKNDHELGVRNGMLGIVENTEKNKLTIMIDADTGERSRRVTLATKHYRSYDHGYATIIHKSQGATVDRAFVLASTTMNRHLTYVAMTRHRKSVRLYSDRNTLNKIERVNSTQPERRSARKRHYNGPSRN